jgi:hypothetical protein
MRARLGGALIGLAGVIFAVRWTSGLDSLSVITGAIFGVLVGGGIVLADRTFGRRLRPSAWRTFIASVAVLSVVASVLGNPSIRFAVGLGLAATGFGLASVAIRENEHLGATEPRDDPEATERQR